MSESVIVGALPPCDFCGAEACVDGKTYTGPWAMMCSRCWQDYGVGLGTGRGQKLELRK